MSEPNQNTQVALTQQNIGAFLSEHKNEIARRLESLMPPERMIQSVIVAAQNTPGILECTPKSILMAVFRASEVGLSCTGGTLGEGYLIPYKNYKEGTTECKFVPGYRGLIGLLLRGSDYKEIEASEVWTCDHFKIVKGTDPVFEHVPFDGPRPADAKIRGAYCIGVRFIDGRPFRKPVWVPIEDIMKIAAKGGPIWKSHFPQMCVKTAVRRFCNTASISNERLRAACEAYDAIEGDMIDVTDRAEGASPSAKDIARPAAVGSASATQHPSPTEFIGYWNGASSESPIPNTVTLQIESASDEKDVRSILFPTKGAAHIEANAQARFKIAYRDVGGRLIASGASIVPDPAPVVDGKAEEVNVPKT